MRGFTLGSTDGWLDLPRCLFCGRDFDPQDEDYRGAAVLGNAAAMWRPKTETWEAGRYVLLVDRYTSPSGQREHRKGDELELDAAEATRLGNAEAIAPAKAEARLGEEAGGS